MVHGLSAKFTTAGKPVLNYANCKNFVDGPPKSTFLETKIWRTLLHKEMNNEERNEQWKKWTMKKETNNERNEQWIPPSVVVL